MNALEQALNYLERVPHGRVPVKVKAVAESFPGRRFQPAELWENTCIWAEHHKLDVTHDGKTPVLTETYYFTRKPGT